MRLGAVQTCVPRSTRHRESLPERASLRGPLVAHGHGVLAWQFVADAHFSWLKSALSTCLA